MNLWSKCETTASFEIISAVLFQIEFYLQKSSVDASRDSCLFVLWNWKFVIVSRYCINNILFFVFVFIKQACYTNAFCILSIFEIIFCYVFRNFIIHQWDDWNCIVYLYRTNYYIYQKQIPLLPQKKIMSVERKKETMPTNMSP